MDMLDVSKGYFGMEYTTMNTIMINQPKPESVATFLE